MTLPGLLKHQKPFSFSAGLIGRLALLTLVAASSLVLSTPAQSAQSPPSPNATKTDDEQELLKARKANEEAQAEYYRRQTQELDKKPEQKSFLRNLVDSPAAIAGLIAAIVALISFYFTFHATRRNQMDTAFYEALKRFGDKDSPTVRSSAAGLLAQMGQGQKRRVRSSWRKRLFPATQRYYKTSFNQLITGLLLEKNTICLVSNSDAIKELIPINPKSAIKKLCDSNLRIQEELCVLLAKLWGALLSAPTEDLLDEKWGRAAHLAGYGKEVLRDFIKRHDPLFLDSRKRFHVSFASMTDAKRIEALLSVETSIQVTSSRLKANVELCCQALHQPLHQQKDELRFYGLFLVGGDLMGAQLRYLGFYGAQMTGVSFYGADLSGVGFMDAEMAGCDFANANMSNAWLVRTDLWHAGLTQSNLIGANLTDARLRGAKLYEAKIDNSTDFHGTNWWAARFDNPISQPNEIDTALIKKLYGKYPTGLPSDLNEVDPSVREFIELELQKEEPTAEPVK